MADLTGNAPANMPLMVQQSGLTSNVLALPVIAIVDTGVPADHAMLKNYLRGTYTSPTSMATNPDPHGCFVASRAVFGEVDLDDGPQVPLPAPSTRFYDVNIGGIDYQKVDGKSVYPALQAIVSTAPDVRVFNMSFDTEALSLIDSVKRSECLTLIQNLDNFIFQNDILVVVAAGNSPQGIQPTTPYPRHANDPNWELGAWARSFNSLTCGSAVGKPSFEGLVKNVGWPSAFSKVGPGFGKSVKPDYVADGGNCNSNYAFSPNLGVWCLSPSAMWEDHIGTSLAAPILSRQVAFALQALEKVCARGSRPFGVLVKAFLALTSQPTASEKSLSPIKELAARALGRGYASATKLTTPDAGTAVFLWQGVLEDDKDIARVQIPIPSAWLANATEPHLKVVVAYDPPVNAALDEKWATRKVNCHLRSQADADALRTRNLDSSPSYPLVRRLYKLPKDEAASDDTWLLELSYEQIGEYYPVMQFASQQRVALAAELLDHGGGESPQAAIQAMPIAASMVRLTVPPPSSRTPVFVRTTT